MKIKAWVLIARSLLGFLYLVGHGASENDCNASLRGKDKGQWRTTQAPSCESTLMTKRHWHRREWNDGEAGNIDCFSGAGSPAFGTAEKADRAEMNSEMNISYSFILPM